MLLQIATDLGQTGDVINAVIAGFLIVAALLAVSTVWFWRHTDPRRKRGQLRDVQPIDVRVDGADTGVWQDDASSPFEPSARVDAGLSDSDWARMTAPRHRSQRPVGPQG